MGLSGFLLSGARFIFVLFSSWVLLLTMFLRFEYVADLIYAFGSISKSRRVESPKAGTKLFLRRLNFVSRIFRYECDASFCWEMCDLVVGFYSFAPPFIVVLIY